jgi:hypothetical protein
VKSAEGAWATNGVSLSFWRKSFADDVTWLAIGQCAENQEQAEALALGAGSFGGTSTGFERVSEAYESGRWYTLRELSSGLHVRVADCDTIADFVDPAELDGQSEVEDAFTFSREVSRAEAMQLIMDVEAHRNTDHLASGNTPGPERYQVAFGAGESETGASLISCVVGPDEVGWQLVQRRYLFDEQDQRISYQEEYIGDFECGS